MEQISNLNHFQQLLFYSFPPPLDQYNHFWSYKKRVPKLNYFDGWVPKCSPRVTLATSGAGVVCYICCITKKVFKSLFYKKFNFWVASHFKIIK